MVRLSRCCKISGRWGFWIHGEGGSRFYHRNWQTYHEAEHARREYALGLQRDGQSVQLESKP